MTTYRSPWMDKDLDDLAEVARNFFEKDCAPHEELPDQLGAWA